MIIDHDYDEFVTEFVTNHDHTGIPVVLYIYYIIEIGPAPKRGRMMIAGDSGRR